MRTSIRFSATAGRKIAVGVGFVIFAALVVISSGLLNHERPAPRPPPQLVTLHSDKEGFVMVALTPDAADVLLRYAAKPDRESLFQVKSREEGGLLFPVENGTRAEVIAGAVPEPKPGLVRLMLTSGPHSRTVVWCPRAVVK